MRFETLALLRCPFCGSKVELNTGVFHQVEANGEIRDALLACRCCEFLVSDGIAVMTLWPEAEVARAAIADQRPADALRAMLNFTGDAPASKLIGPGGARHIPLDRRGRRRAVRGRVLRLSIFGSHVRGR